MDSLPFQTSNAQNQTIRGNLFFPQSGFFEDLIILSNPSDTNQEALVPWADFFCRHGMAVITFDFCGGTPDSSSDGEYFDMSVLTEANDLKAVLDYCFTIFPVARIWVVGISQGGLAAALAAADEPGVDGLILFSPAFVIPDLGRSMYGSRDRIPERPHVLGTPVGRRYYLDTIDMDVFEAVCHYSGPVLIIHGEKDPEVPVWYAKEAANRYPDARLLLFAEEGHLFSENSWMDSMRKIVRFIDERSQKIVPLV